MNSPGLPLSLYCNPRTYVVQGDLAELGRDWRPRHAPELARWSRETELSPTALTIAAVLHAFRGLRRGPHGCGTQAPLEAWARLVGCSRRMAAYAFDQLEAAGWARRHRRLVKHEWTDEQGRAWKRCDVHGASYLTAKGAVRVGVRLEQRGVVEKLWRTAAAKLRVLARRVTDALFDCTPSLRRSAKPKASNSRSGFPVGSEGSARPVRAHSLEPPVRRASSREPVRGTEQRVTPGPQGWGGFKNSEHAGPIVGDGPWARWPDAWRDADAKGRRWLSAEFLQQVELRGRRIR